MVAVMICAVSTSEVLILPDVAISLVAMTSMVTDCSGWWLAQRVVPEQSSVFLVSTIMKRGALKATCLLCDSEKFVLVVNLNVGQCWVLILSPLQMCAVKAKVMVTMFTLGILIQLWC